MHRNWTGVKCVVQWRVNAESFCRVLDIYPKRILQSEVKSFDGVLEQKMWRRFAGDLHTHTHTHSSIHGWNLNRSNPKTYMCARLNQMMARIVLLISLDAFKMYEIWWIKWTTSLVMQMVKYMFKRTSYDRNIRVNIHINNANRDERNTESIQHGHNKIKSNRIITSFFSRWMYVHRHNAMKITQLNVIVVSYGTSHSSVARARAGQYRMENNNTHSLTHRKSEIIIMRLASISIHFICRASIFSIAPETTQRTQSVYRYALALHIIKTIARANERTQTIKLEIKCF